MGLSLRGGTIMKKLLKTFAVASLGLAALVSCNTNKGSDTASSEKDTSSSAPAVSNKVLSKKTSGYIDGLNKTIDLAEFFEFQGAVSIDNLEFSSLDITNEGKIISLSGHKVTSIGYGNSSIMPDKKAGSPFLETAEFRSILIRVLNPKDVVHKFASSCEGTSKMSFEIKNDGTFAFSRTAGTIPGSGGEVTVKDADIKGSYNLGDDGIFVFTPSTKDYCEFKATLNYDETDGSKYHLNVFTPIDSTTIDLLGIKFNVAE